MKRIIHVAFGDSAAGLLKHTFSQMDVDERKNILNFEDDLSVGPIDDLDTQDGIENRYQYFVGIYSNFYEDDGSGTYCAVELDCLSSIDLLNSYDEIIIWHAGNVRDQLALSYIVTYTTDISIYEVDIEEAAKMLPDELIPYPRSLAEVSSDTIRMLYEQISLIDEVRLTNLKAQWADLKSENGLLRIYEGYFEGYELISVPIDYYDKLILKCVGYPYMKAAHVIGCVLGSSVQLVSDLFIEWRLRQLLNKNELIYKGQLINMQRYEVKLNTSLRKMLIEYFELNCTIDEDGVYHYLIDYVDGKLRIRNDDINNWEQLDLSDVLILDCTDTNELSFVLRVNNEAIFWRTQIAIRNMEIIEEGLVFYTERNEDEAIYLTFENGIKIGIK